MPFPSKMTDPSCKRWLVRKILPGTANKQPYSPLAGKPEGYIPKEASERPNAWRWRWNQLCVCTTHADALVFLKSNRDTCEGLSFVLHPGGDDSEQLRVVCFDFDRAFGPDGNLLSAVQDVLEATDSFVEYSRSGKGLHLFMLVKCTPFTNILQSVVEGDCAADCLCSAQVAVTGKIYETYNQIREVNYDFIESLPFFEHKSASTQQCDTNFGEWWEAAEEPLGEEHESLIAEMEQWPEAVKDHGRSKTTLAAACRIMRDGVIGWQALRLLEMVPTTPPLSEAEAKHKIEDAYKFTKNDGSFGGECPEFGVIVDDSELPSKPEKKEEKKHKISIYTIAQLDALDVSLDFVVKGAFVDKESMFVGGREKTFKTGITFDLLLSLAACKPFLGRFEVDSPRSSVFFTAEIGLPARKDLARRIRGAKGIPARSVHNMRVAGYMPDFTSTIELGTLEKLFDELKPDTAAFDPLYFAMGGAAVGDMYEIGKVLRDITNICEARNIWPIFCHHARMDRTKEFCPMELHDLYGSGVAAFARQWCLLSHASPYIDGLADLHMKMGGSSTHDLGLWSVKITEGIADGVLDSCRWDVIIEEGGVGDNGQEDEILDLISDEPMSKKDIAAISGLTISDVTKVIRRLVKDSRVSCQNSKFMRITDDTTPTEETI